MEGVQLVGLWRPEPETECRREQAAVELRAPADATIALIDRALAKSRRPHCGQCGETLPEGARTCHSCGLGLVTIEGRASKPPQFVTIDGQRVPRRAHPQHPMTRKGPTMMWRNDPAIAWAEGYLAGGRAARRADDRHRGVRVVDVPTADLVASVRDTRRVYQGYRRRLDP